MARPDPNQRRETEKTEEPRPRTIREALQRQGRTQLVGEKMKSDAGLGVRFKSSRATLFRFDLARGNEGYKAQFRFSASF